MPFIVGVVGALIAGYVWFVSRSRSAQNPGARNTGLVSGVAIVVLLGVAFFQMVAVIPAGHVGVVDFFGTVSDQTIKAGINLVNPLAKIVHFSVKTQEIKETMDVPSKEGMTVQLEISALYHMSPEKAAQTYKSVGENYVSVILEPQFRSVARGVTAGFDAKALYTSEREMLAQIIMKDLQKICEVRGIIIEATPLRRVILPAGLTQSIEEKLRAEQESQRMEFVLMKEKQEADRKRIEAQGISDFQDIVAKGISPQLLEWKGIEATEKLASSPNAKLVIVGGGKNGLPVILNTQ